MVEVDARIQKVLNIGVSLDRGVGPIPLQRWITCARVSMLGPVSAAFMILYFHCARDTSSLISSVCISFSASRCGSPVDVGYSR
jgi:hypothetical protein